MEQRWRRQGVRRRRRLDGPPGEGGREFLAAASFLVLLPVEEGMSGLCRGEKRRYTRGETATMMHCCSRTEQAVQGVPPTHLWRANRRLSVSVKGEETYETERTLLLLEDGRAARAQTMSARGKREKRRRGRKSVPLSAMLACYSVATSERA